MLTALVCNGTPFTPFWLRTTMTPTRGPPNNVYWQSRDLVSPLAIWQHYSQKENAFFQKTVFFCFCLRVTDISYRNVSRQSNNCQTLSVLNFNCSARVLKRTWSANGCNTSNSKTQCCHLGCRRKHWCRIDVGISQSSLRPLLHTNTTRNLPLQELCFRDVPLRHASRT